MITRAIVDGRDVYIADEADMHEILAESQAFKDLLEIATAEGNWEAIISRLEDIINGRNG